MKNFFVLSAIGALSLGFGTAGFADGNVVGSVRVQIDPDAPGPGSQYMVNDVGTQLTGFGGGETVLYKQAGGYKGFSFGRPFNLTCTATKCSDAGSTQLDVKITPMNNGGYKLQGTINFVNFDAMVSPKRLTFSANGFHTDIEFELDGRREGNYSGSGSSHGAHPFSASIYTSGTLTNLKDPATFIVTIASPFIRD